LEIKSVAYRPVITYIASKKIKAMTSIIKPILTILDHGKGWFLLYGLALTALMIYAKWAKQNTATPGRCRLCSIRK